ncbi:MAG: NAD-dependent epimerase/dehydratase family protein [Planctomycetaceae bacterium]|jgi:nucleoside-diphosphate-sugar epimerase|nr:NAD-dependent epimerase/dehydratase family protein [Planctomycetaceae bacterium]
MTSLVIGGTGFLGGEIVRQLLERGKRVRVLCRKKPTADFVNGAEIFLGSIAGSVAEKEILRKAFQDVETVYHTASLPSISVHWKPFYETNIVGTQNVLDVCKETGVRKLIYTSSASVSFNCQPQINIDETLPYPKKFIAHYPRSKSAAEKLVLESSQSHSLLTCAIRPHLIIGKKDRHLLPRLFNRARTNRLFRVGGGTNVIDIIFVENAALGHLLAAEALTDKNSPVNGSVYFLSQGQPVNCWDWINEVLTMKGLPKVRRSISFSAAWRIGQCLETGYKLLRLQGEPVMTRFLAAQLALPHYLNISKARRDLGYEPLISMDEGMKQLSESMTDM